MKSREDKIILSVLIILIALILGRNYIRFWFSGGDDVAFGMPEAFHFSSETGSVKSELCELREDGFCEENVNYYDSEKKIYHLFIDENLLGNNDVSVYATGHCWNYPYDPVVKINGEIIEDTSSEHNGKTDWDTYFSRAYHFRVYDTIIEGKKYEIYVRFGDYSEEINVMFHKRID